MQTITHKTYRDVLRELAQQRAAMIEELAALVVEDPNILIIPPRELQLVELAGYVVDLHTGEVEPIDTHTNGGKQ